MPLAIRHRSDAVAPIEPLAGLSVRREVRATEMARLQGRPVEEMERRLAEGHRAWVASIDGADASFGWVATKRARIGELDLDFAIPAGERYLWNFVTRPSFRGRGIYPRLLEAIVRAESADAERFWIIWAPENRASGAGIGKAGFVPVAELSFDADGRAAAAGVEAERAARLLSIARTSGAVAPCWKCARAGRAWVMFCPPGECACDYQRPEIDCHPA